MKQALSIFALGFATGALALITLFPRPSLEVDAVEASSVLPVRGTRVSEPVVALKRAPLAPAALRTPARATQATASAAAPTAHVPSAREVADRALSATAFIHGDGVYGAGILIGPRAVLTCLHVVEDMKRIRLELSDGTSLSAEVVDRDENLDLAVLRAELPRTPDVPLASASGVKLGDTVYAMGAPRKLRFSLSRGLVSHAERLYGGVPYLQTDLATNSGSSGGPVLDEQGRVIAVSSFILKDSQGLSFALPIDQARRRFGQYFTEPHTTAQ